MSAQPDLLEPTPWPNHDLQLQPGAIYSLGASSVEVVAPNVLIRRVRGARGLDMEQTFADAESAWRWANGFLSAFVARAGTTISAKDEYCLPACHTAYIAWHANSPMAPLEILVADSPRSEEWLFEEADWYVGGSQLDRHYDLLSVMQVARLLSNDGEADFKIAASLPADFRRPHMFNNASMRFHEVSP